MRDERGDVAAEEVLAVADADDERAVAAGADDDVRCVGVHGDQREGALEAAADRAHRLGQVAGLLVRLAEQVRGDLGVGVAAEVAAAPLELGPERREVLDDPVVDDGDPAGVVQVRVGVAVGGRAVGRPARVTHPHAWPAGAGARRAASPG